jgi:SAM-dependent methyltransferase
MSGRNPKDDLSIFLSPSPSLLRFKQGLLSLPPGPFLDLGCGFGRNAIALAGWGLSVIAMDRDFERLVRLKNASGCLLHEKNRNLQVACADFSGEWPIALASLSAIVCIHFPDPQIIRRLNAYLKPNGGLYFETFGGQGKNYLHLPRMRELEDAIKWDFRTIYYNEQSVGPPELKVVTVRTFAIKN